MLLSHDQLSDAKSPIHSILGPLPNRHNRRIHQPPLRLRTVKLPVDRHWPDPRPI